MIYVGHQSFMQHAFEGNQKERHIYTVNLPIYHR